MSPGTTMQPVASMRSASTCGGRSARAPTASMTPSRISTNPSEKDRRPASIVITNPPSTSSDPGTGPPPLACLRHLEVLRVQVELPLRRPEARLRVERRRITGDRRDGVAVQQLDGAADAEDRAEHRHDPEHR